MSAVCDAVIWRNMSAITGEDAKRLDGLRDGEEDATAGVLAVDACPGKVIDAIGRDASWQALDESR